jgi:hypothetical protein
MNISAPAKVARSAAPACHLLLSWLLADEKKDEKVAARSERERKKDNDCAVSRCELSQRRKYLSPPHMNYKTAVGVERKKKSSADPF